MKYHIIYHVCSLTFRFLSSHTPFLQNSVSSLDSGFSSSSVYSFPTETEPLSDEAAFMMTFKHTHDYVCTMHSHTHSLMDRKWQCPHIEMTVWKWLQSDFQTNEARIRHWITGLMFPQPITGDPEVSLSCSDLLLVKCFAWANLNFDSHQKMKRLHTSVWPLVKAVYFHQIQLYLF